jgi:hypothetical protein
VAGQWQSGPILCCADILAGRPLYRRDRGNDHWLRMHFSPDKELAKSIQGTMPKLLTHKVDVSILVYSMASDALIFENFQ